MTTPIVWSIAASDSGGGAGIQADIKTIHGLGGHPSTVLTAVTAQNTQSVSDIEMLSAQSIAAQLKALRDDLPPRAIKIGMLGSVEGAKIIAAFLSSLDTFVVLDPVMRSTSKAKLADDAMISLIKTAFLPRANLITPNLFEAELLTGVNIRDFGDFEEATQVLLEMGAKSVLIKGGDFAHDLAADFFSDGIQNIWFSSTKSDNRNSHGTGCTLSSAIATSVAKGYELPCAITIAKSFVNEALSRARLPCEGISPLQQKKWPSQPEHLPKIFLHRSKISQALAFPPWPSSTIGFYPIVDRFSWVKKLVACGVKTMQLRIKDLHAHELEEELRRAIRHAKEHGCQLVVNDHWQVALQEEAFGIHLGQDDLDDNALYQISQAQMCLGISTHSYAEMARANALSPSYIALGTLFDTSSKVMTYPPLGLTRFADIARLSRVPVVAIGGISLENALDVMEAGASGISLISDLQRASDLHARTRGWLELFEKPRASNLNLTHFCA